MAQLVNLLEAELLEMQEGPQLMRRRVDRHGLDDRAAIRPGLHLDQTLNLERAQRLAHRALGALIVLH